MNNLTAHLIIRNEIMFVGYAIESIIDIVDKVLIIDTGSDDGTIELIRYLQKKYSDKIEIVLKKDKVDGSKWICGVNEKEVTTNVVTESRNELIKQTKTEFMFTVDGDEVYDYKTVKKVKEAVKWGNNGLNGADFLCIHLKWFCKDIFHIDIDKYTPTCRVYRNIKGLNVKRPFPNEYHYIGSKQVNLNNKKQVLYMSNNYWFYHYEMVKCPQRRKISNMVEYEGEQPEVFYKSFTKDYFKKKKLFKYIYV